MKMKVELKEEQIKELKEYLKQEINIIKNNIVIETDNNGWIKCSDRLPKHEQIVDIYTNTEEGRNRVTDCMYCDYEEDKGTTKHFYDERYDYIYTLRNVSHWKEIVLPMDGVENG